MNLRGWIVAGLLLLSSMRSSLVMAANQIAVLTRVEGEVKLFGASSDEHPGTPALPHATFEGSTYSVRTAKVGDRLERGNIIKTGPGGKARFIYQNGDQITVAPGTAFRLKWDAKKEDKPVMELFFGKVRALIQSEGPRTGLEVKTRSSVMGVRGTDFHVAAWSKAGGSELSVLRGKVQVAQIASGPNKSAEPSAKPIEVAAGYSAVIKALPSKIPGVATANVVEKIAVQQTPREKLVLIQKVSKIDKGAAPVGADIAILEKQAVVTVMQDIKAEDPALFKSLSEGGKAPEDTDEIQTKTVKKLFLAAPVNLKGGNKPVESDLEGGDAYDKYKWDDDE